jgi:hypothetical protein
MNRQTQLKGLAWMLLTLILALMTGACSSAAGSTPIAVYQKDAPIAQYPQNPPIGQYPPQPPLTYHAYLEVQVNDVDRSARRAVELAAGYGGYLVSSQSWSVDNRKVTTLELAVPPTWFDDLRLKLAGLGSKLSEVVQGERAAPPAPGRIDYGYEGITLTLRQEGFEWPAAPSAGWDPARTFREAWGVFVSIFGFLIDILIWIGVVLGPFIIIGLLILLIVRRARRPASP